MAIRFKIVQQLSRRFIRSQAKQSYVITNDLQKYVFFFPYSYNNNNFCPQQCTIIHRLQPNAYKLLRQPFSSIKSNSWHATVNKDTKHTIFIHNSKRSLKIFGSHPEKPIHPFKTFKINEIRVRIERSFVEHTPRFNTKPSIKAFLYTDFRDLIIYASLLTRN